ncbi:MAG: DUF3467 domain-containing protein [Planctomycetota bacterium]|nr:MAG: DUF3467 domain-containing protein [Planctomycetota bacterium]
MHDEEGRSSGDVPPDDAPYTQQVRHRSIGALVPERVARGVFSTGAVILNGAHEFIIDFLLRMNKPHQIAARVVLPPGVVPRFILALQDNLKTYERRFGAIPKPPAPKPDPQAELGVSEQTVQAGSPATAANKPQVSAEELYEQLKFSDEELAGSYANAVMIAHTAAEFSFDFITTFFPRSVVCKRVFLSAPNVPRLLDSLQQSYEQYRQKLIAAGVPAPPSVEELRRLQRPADAPPVAQPEPESDSPDDETPPD